MDKCTVCDGRGKIEVHDLDTNKDYAEICDYCNGEGKI